MVSSPWWMHKRLDRQRWSEGRRASKGLLGSKTPGDAGSSGIQWQCMSPRRVPTGMTTVVSRKEDAPRRGSWGQRYPALLGRLEALLGLGLTLTEDSRVKEAGRTCCNESKDSQSKEAVRMRHVSLMRASWNWLRLSTACLVFADRTSFRELSGEVLLVERLT